MKSYLLSNTKREYIKHKDALETDEKDRKEKIRENEVAAANR